MPNADEGSSGIDELGEVWRHRRMRIHMASVAIGVLAAAVLLHCSSKHDAASSSSDGGSANEGGGGEASSNDDAGSPCPSTKGPTMILVPASAGDFCIDSTEVTRGQYADFLASNPPLSPTPQCAWKTNYTPNKDWPPAAGTENLPVTWVDQCDAAGFCAWAGKRLCGIIGGGDGTTNALGTVSQWQVACSADGAKTYAYGNGYVAGKCNSANDGGPVAVGSMPDCQGGYPGIFDMSGNVQEWRAACDVDSGAAGPASDRCVLGGGSYLTPAASQACGAAFIGNRDGKFADLGFRCCGP
jgi:formylglycine-generating enzyme required for sulfatase activity